jgi:peptidoglycan/xylan/chitin deacetylase (PgdA/CDA1 family)
MGTLDRRQVMVSLAAAGAGVLAAALPEVLHHSATAAAKNRAAAVSTPTTPPDPGYARAPLRALTRPVHNLHQLSPAAPPTAIALTIDDGPHPTYTPMMLDLLASFHVPATFNMIGVQVSEYPQLVQRIVAAGHQVADHTVTHPLNLPSLPTAKIVEEIAGGHDRIAQTTGVAPKFFRSPGGNWSPAVLDTAAAHAMICIDWQVDPRDWDQPRSSVNHISTTLLKAQAGDILLCHDGGGPRKRTIEALRVVIPALQQRGLTFVAL